MTVEMSISSIHLFSAYAANGFVRSEFESMSNTVFSFVNNRLEMTSMNHDWAIRWNDSVDSGDDNGTFPSFGPTNCYSEILLGRRVSSSMRYGTIFEWYICNWHAVGMITVSISSIHCTWNFYKWFGNVTTIFHSVLSCFGSIHISYRLKYLLFWLVSWFSTSMIRLCRNVVTKKLE